MKRTWLQWIVVLSIGASLAAMTACDTSSDDDDEGDGGTTGTTTTTVTTPALTAPTQVSPADGTPFSHFPRSVTLVWQSVAGAAKYKVEIQYFSSGSWTAYPIVTVTDPTYTFNFIGDQPGRWRVWAVDASDVDGPSSGWFGFDFSP